MKKQTQREEEISNDVIKLFERERDKRGNWETHWQEIAERIWPMQARLFVGQKDSGIQGDKRNELIFDSTPVTALNRFGAILDSLLTPRNQTWHRLVPTNDLLKRDRQVMQYFEDVNKILFRLRYAPNANFASQNQFTYKMLGAYGNSALFIDKLKGSHGEKGFRYRNVHLSEIWFLENHQGIVDTCIRQARVFPRQVIQQFGEENCPGDVVEMAKSNKEEWLNLYHCVKPRTDVDFGTRKDAKGKPYAMYYVLERGRHLLEEGGYDCFPYAITRYEQSPNEVYGRSPAMDALPSIKTLNEQKKTMLKQGHRATDPVLLAHDDGVLDSFSLRPGAINPGGVTANGQPLVHALPVGNVQTGKDMMDEERSTIKSAFLVDLFQILEETPEMTATEVMERVKEKGILLNPILGRQEAEYLGPMVQREFTIANELGLLPPPPQVLLQAGGEYHLEYDSPLSRSQKAEGIAGGFRLIDNFMQIAQTTQNPAIMDHFNFDEIIPDAAYGYAMPERWLNDDKAIAQIRQGRQQQMQQQQAMQAAPGTAALIKSAAVAQEKAPELADKFGPAIAGATGAPGKR